MQGRRHSLLVWLAVAAFVWGAAIGSPTEAQAQGTVWHRSSSPTPCGSDGLGCALADMFYYYPNVVRMHFCGYTYNYAQELTGAMCEGETAGGLYRTGYANYTCNTDFTPTATGCDNLFDRDPNDCASPDSGGASPNAAQGIVASSLVGNPVDAKAGVKKQTATDFSTNGAAQLAFERTYWNTMSYWAGTSMTSSRLGRGWRSNFDARLLQIPVYPSTVYIVLPDGRELRFNPSGGVYYPYAYNAADNSWPPAPQLATYSLVWTGTQWELTQPDDSKLVFDSTGLLTSIQYRGGYTQTLTWSGGKNTQVTDNLGRSITFAYGANGRLSELTDPDGNKIKYSYTEHAGFGSVSVPPGVDVSNVDHPDYVLEKVIYPDDTPATDADNPTVQYHYEDSAFVFALTGITDERNVRYATWSYNTSGRVATGGHAGGADAFTFSYDDVNSQTTVTNALGKHAVYHYDRNVPGVSRLTQIEGKASTHCAAADTDFGYDGNGFLNRLTDGERRVTTLANDVRGLPSAVTRGFGTPVAATTSYTWHATLRVPTEIVEPGLTTDFIWNASNRLTRVTQTDTTSQTMPYPTNGQKRIWKYTYTTAAGLLASVDGPLAGTADTVSYGYNSNGFIQTVTNELGQVTTFTTWNGRGQPTSLTDPNGVITRLAYDERGRLTGITADPGADQALTSIDYDAAGDIVKITRPNGAFLAFTWDDARRLATIKDNTNASITFTRDALGGITARQIKNAGGTTLLSQTATYDELGRLLTFVGASAQTWRLGYDKTDNLTSVTDPRSNIYRQAFDPLNRLLSTTAEDGGVVTLTRNGKDEITGYADPNSLATGYVRDGFGEVIQQSSPDSGTTVYVYDYSQVTGKVIKITDARGIETDLSYDVAGRLTGKTFPATPGEKFTLSWDETAGGNKGIGRLTKADGQGGRVQLTYNKLGQITQEKKVIVNVPFPVNYSYDPAGNVVQMVYPSGRIVSYSRDAVGRIAGVTTQADAASPVVTLASGIGYMPFGALSVLTYGNGLILSKSYTQDYQLDILRVRSPPSGANTLRRIHAYADGYNLTAITETAVSGRNESYGYDPANRLNAATGAWGGVTYSYDKVGNRTSAAIAGLFAPHQYNYAPGTNRLSTVMESALRLRGLSYDAAGNITADDRAGTVYGTVYNDRGRLKQSQVDGQVRANYRYDFFERLMWRQTLNMTPAATTDYVEDLQGRLIAEADAASGTTQREYIWVDDLPLAVFSDLDTPSPKRYYVHADQLNRPLRMTDAAQAVVWDAVYEPFGTAASITGPATLNLRFPGQYFLIESGLAYNWHRHYDSTIGRYTQPDPLGLEAMLTDGPSVYAYANSRPSMKVDIQGQQSTTIPSAPNITPIPPEYWPGTPENRRWSEQFIQGLKGLANACYRIATGSGTGGDRNGPGCKEEWAEARQFCENELSKPNPNRRLTGGYRNVEDCARGLVSERCGGNAVR
jgi:RHS repeat-associated protein